MALEQKRECDSGAKGFVRGVQRLSIAIINRAILDATAGKGND